MSAHNWHFISQLFFKEGKLAAHAAGAIMRAMVAVRVVLPDWLVHDGQVPAPHDGASLAAVVEAWTWRIRETSESKDSIEQLDGPDPQGHEGALYQLTGKVLRRDGGSWFLGVGDLVIPGDDQLLTPRPGHPKPGARDFGASSDPPNVDGHMEIVATLAIAHNGSTRTEWDGLSATHDWTIRAVIEEPSRPLARWHWLLDLGT